MPSVRKPAFALVALCLAYGASPALAASASSTRLVNCESRTCLLISGHRDSAASEVRIGGQAVAVEGARNWRVRLPVETVKSWSAPFARTIEITFFDPRTQGVSSENAVLPIGLMGHADLASLVIDVRRPRAGQAIAMR